MEWLTPDMISGVGFPIVVAAYLLVRMEKVIGTLTETVRENTVLVKVLAERVNTGDK